MDETTNKKRVVDRIKNIPKVLALGCITIYRRFISPLFPPTCRYVPTCSEYAIIAVERFGFVKGCWLALKRISRCHPFHEGGYDPVPEVYKEKR